MIIDISEHQGNIDWIKVAKNKDIEAVIIRAGYGQDIKSQDDKMWKKNIEAVIKYNIPFGVYLYSYAKTTQAIKGEVDHLIRLIKPYKDKMALPAYIDIEEPGTGPGCTARIKEFYKLMKEKGYKPGLYTGEWWYNAYIKGAIKNTLWIAKYGVNDGKPHDKPKIGVDYDLWQYTSKVKIAGIPGTVDANILYNDDLIKKDTKKITKKEDDKIMLKVTAKSGLNCRKSAKQDGAILGAFEDGTRLQLINKTNKSWYKVKGKDSTGKTIEGYCSAKYLLII